MLTLSQTEEKTIILKEKETKDLVNYYMENSYHRIIGNIHVNYINEIYFDKYKGILINGKEVFSVNNIIEEFSYIKENF